MSDFSLMHAIECGIVKLPRVPVAENIPGDEMPVYRNLWEHIRKEMPKKGRGTGGDLDPLQPPEQAANSARSAVWSLPAHLRPLAEARHLRPALLHRRLPEHRDLEAGDDYISGFYQKDESGERELVQGRLALFRNFDDTTGNPLARPTRC